MTKRLAFSIQRLNFWNSQMVLNVNKTSIQCLQCNLLGRNLINWRGPALEVKTAFRYAQYARYHFPISQLKYRVVVYPRCCSFAYPQKGILGRSCLGHVELRLKCLPNRTIHTHRVCAQGIVNLNNNSGKHSQMPNNHFKNLEFHSKWTADLKEPACIANKETEKV